MDRATKDKRQKMMVQNYSRGQDFKKEGYRKEESNSDYPSSSDHSQLKRSQRTFPEGFSEEQQAMVGEYLQSARDKEKEQLLAQRDELLQQLHNINNHLGEMITQLHGELNISTPRQQRQKNKSKLTQGEYSPVFQRSKNKKSISNTIQPTPHNQNQHKLINNSRITNINNSRITNINSIDNEKLSSKELTALENKNNKLIESLTQEIQDYEFMITADYWQGLDQEIIKSIAIKKQLQQELISLQKIVNKHTKSYDKETITKLEKYSYDNQVELTFLNKKLQNKINKLNNIQTQNKQKIQKTKQLSAEEAELNKLLQMYEDEEYQGTEESKTKNQQYQKLQIKKTKLQKILNSYNNNHLQIYNKKLSKLRDLQNKIEQTQELIKKMEHDIHLISNQRKQFQNQNPDLVTSNYQISTPVTLKILNEQKPKSFQRIQDQTVSSPNKNRIKLASEHQKPKTKQDHHNSLDTFQENQINSYFGGKDVRRRIYTELQNSHYFSSLGKKHYRNQLPTQQTDLNIQQEKQKTEESLKYSKYKAINQLHIPTSDNSIEAQKPIQSHQRKFNANIYTPKSLQNVIKLNGDLRKIKTPSNQKNSRKGISDERELESEYEIQKKLAKLQSFLQKDHINLSFQQKSNYPQLNNKQRLNDKKRANIIPDEASTSTQMRQGQKPLKTSESHYRELCEKLGKNKLLIEQDTDISALIYQGISGKT